MNPTKTRWKGSKSIRGKQYVTNTYYPTALDAARALDGMLKSAGITGAALPNQEALAKYANVSSGAAQPIDLPPPQVPASISTPILETMGNMLCMLTKGEN